MITTIANCRILARSTSFVFVLLFALALVPDAPAQSSIGYVLDVKCDWFMNQQRLGRATPVTAGAQIRFQNTNQTNCGIVVLNNNGAVLVKRDCNRAGECDRPFRLPNTTAQPSVLSRIASAVQRLLWSSPPEKYESTISRDRDMNEAVVQLNNSVVDLSPVFRGLEAGTYNLRMTPVPRDKKPGVTKELRPVVFAWQPPQSQSVRVEGLTPGLYVLNLLDRLGDELAPSDAEVWVLVSEPSRYQSRAASFEKARSLTESWGEDVKPDVKHTFLKTYLYHLAVK